MLYVLGHLLHSNGRFGCNHSAGSNQDPFAVVRPEVRGSNSAESVFHFSPQSASLRHVTKQNGGKLRKQARFIYFK